MDLVDVLEPQPLRREPGAERLASRVGQHPPHLLFERRRESELAAAASVRSSLSGGAPHRKNDSRDARS